MDHIDKPDFTAWFVLQGLIAAMHQPEFRDSKNDASLAFHLPLSIEASKTRLMSRFIASLPYSWQYVIGDLVTNNGRLRHFYLRKKEIEKQVRTLLAGGDITQIVILGAGLDTLSLRLAPDFSNIKFIEIDTKESQQFKTHALAAHNIHLPTNVELIEGDLRNPLAEILAQSKFHDATAKTLWLAEGLFMFIPEESVIRIFKEIRIASTINSHIIFTTLPQMKYTSAFGYFLQCFYLKKEKCPFQWVLPSSNIKNFISNAGYEATYQLDYATLHKEYISGKIDNNRAIGEDIHIAKTI